MKNNESGQIIVEYILLLVFAVSMAVLIMDQLVSRNENQPGLVTRKWSAIIQAVGVDFADDVKRD